MLRPVGRSSSHLLPNFYVLFIMTHKIAVLPGDGIGPEITEQAQRVLGALGMDLEMAVAPVGGAAYDLHGHPLPPETLSLAQGSDAVLFGAMGLPDVRGPEGLELGAQVEMRAHYGLFSSLRPVRLFPGVESPVKAKNVDDARWLEIATSERFPRK